MEVEIIPRPKSKPSKIISILLYVSLAALILTAGAYLQLKSIEKKSSQELESLKETLVQKETSSELGQLQGRLSLYKEKIDKISFLLDSYQIGTNFFKFLEKYTHPKVKLSNVSVAIPDSKVSLSGQTADFTTLIQQLYIFENNPQVQDLKLSNFAATKEKKSVNFSINFSLSPNLFKF